MLWIVVAVVVLSLIILAVAVVPLFGRLAGLERAMVRLQRRQSEALTLQQGAEQLQGTLAELQERAELMQHRIELVKAGRGTSDGKHAYLNPHGA